MPEEDPDFYWLYGDDNLLPEHLKNDSKDNDSDD